MLQVRFKKFVFYFLLSLAVIIITLWVRDGGPARLFERNFSVSDLITDDLIEVSVVGVLNDSLTKAPGVVLFAEEGKIALVIQIGTSESMAIQLALEHVEPPRPLTADLMKTVMDTTGSTLLLAVIDAIENNTYYATLFIKDGFGAVTEIDSRPSDAIALALRYQAPVYVHRDILRQYGMPLGNPFSGKPRKT